MLILPEVQIYKGKLVTRSVSSGNHIFHDIPPEEAAWKFEAEGAQWLHVVDVDAARGRNANNSDIVHRILKRASIPVQVAGGVRTLAQISEWFEAGAARLVLGTVAITDHNLVIEAANRHPGGIIVNLATKDDWVMIDGWKTQTSYHPQSLVYDLQLTGIAGVIHTDIDRFEGDASDAMALTTELCRELSIPVYSSGTVHRLDDIARLRYLPNIHGAIVGHALIVGTFTLAEALEVAGQAETSPEPEMINPLAERGLQDVTRAYLASYNLSQADRWWNRALRDAITAENPYVEVLIPQEDLEIDQPSLSPRELQVHYERELDKADVVITILDGIQNEAWTGFECGYARAKGKYLIGIHAQDESAEHPSRFEAMCDDVVSYHSSGELQASLSTIAQELNRRVLLQRQTFNGQ
ncbi:MAG: HisA/HisF-related TIM barrel protein [Gammaproteobacteria bacterium]|nr:HisA/HisF-related TIM barrel protein [Gammaproteobacteria bacterium]